MSIRGRRSSATATLIAMGAVMLAIMAAPATAQITRVSVAADGTTAANGNSGPDVAISGDGRYVVFASGATNLVSADTNGSIDVFVKDRQTHAVERVSVASDGAERAGDSGVGGVAISADGNVVAFSSRAALLATDTFQCDGSTVGGTGPSCSDIYLYNRTTHQTVLVSGGSGPSLQPALNSDGHLVAFTSEAIMVPDTNGTVSDIHLYNVNTSTTIRVSVNSAGAQGPGASSRPTISGDGQMVGFVYVGPGLVDDPDPLPPGDSEARGFVRDLTAGTTTRFPVTPDTTTVTSTKGPYSVTDVGVSADGRWMVEGYTENPNFKQVQVGSLVWDRITGHVAPGAGGRGQGRVTLSPNGRYTAAGGGDGFSAPRSSIAIFDRAVHVSDEVPRGFAPVAGFATLGRFSADGRFLVFATTMQTVVPEDTNLLSDVFVYDRDQDGDGMMSDWETAFNLDAAAAADAGLDPDGDGLTNLQEYQHASHPKGTFKRYFAEGAQNAFFLTFWSLANPGTATALAQLTYFGSDGSRTAGLASVSADASGRIDGRFSGTPENYSTLIESDRPIVADRTMIWGTGLAAGGHSETAIDTPATSWFLAEGATHGAFDLFYLIQNPGDADAQVSVEYLRPAPAPPMTKIYAVAARTRRTIWVDVEDPALEATDVSASIAADRPIIVERAMYYSGRGQSFIAGHSGAGVTAAATRWFLAEGATGDFFDLYVLIANPGATDAELKVTYLLSDGAPVIKNYTVAARSRRTISVEGEDARLASAAVSTIVESTNSQPVIVERSLWWPFSDWYEAHLSAGATATGTRWAFADAAFGQLTTINGLIREQFDTYALIANTSDQAGQATVRTLPISGTPQEVVVPLPANSRVNVRLADVFPAQTWPFGVVIDSGGLPIVVERATYTTADGIIWTRGWNALAARLQ